MNRFTKDYSIDGHPIRDNVLDEVISKDETVNALNYQAETIERLRAASEELAESIRKIGLYAERINLSKDAELIKKEIAAIYKTLNKLEAGEL